jgi:hypothetical protein
MTNDLIERAKEYLNLTDANKDGLNRESLCKIMFYCEKDCPEEIKNLSKALFYTENTQTQNLVKGLLHKVQQLETDLQTKTQNTEFYIKKSGYVIQDKDETIKKLENEVRYLKCELEMFKSGRDITLIPLTSDYPEGTQHLAWNWRAKRWQIFPNIAIPDHEIMGDDYECWLQMPKR